MQYVVVISKMTKWPLSFPWKSFNIAVVQVYATVSNAEEAEVEQYFLELTHKKDILFIIGDCNAKEGSQEVPGVTGKFGCGVQHEAGQRLKESCWENALVITNNLFQQQKRWLYTLAIVKSDSLYCLQPNMEKLYTVKRNKTGSQIWLRSWTAYCQTQT